MNKEKLNEKDLDNVSGGKMNHTHTGSINTITGIDGNKAFAGVDINGGESNNGSSVFKMDIPEKKHRINSEETTGNAAILMD